MAKHPVDVHVGQRLRYRRTFLGMSQESLGDAVGITFQQIQKYERGLNRIGSSRLYDIACVLGTNVGFFFEEYSENSAGNAGSDTENLANKEVLGLVRAYNDINDPNVRKKVLSLIKSLSDNEESLVG